MSIYTPFDKDLLILPVEPLDEDNELLFFPDVSCVGNPKLAIAKGYTRIVIGKRGPYVEFSRHQINNKQYYSPKRTEWRQQDPWKDCVYYFEYRTHNGQKMVYEQIKTVRYADYQVLMFYMSPWDLTTEKYPQLVQGKKPEHHL